MFISDFLKLCSVAKCVGSLKPPLIKNMHNEQARAMAVNEVLYGESILQQPTLIIKTHAGMVLLQNYFDSRVICYCQLSVTKNPEFIKAGFSEQAFEMNEDQWKFIVSKTIYTL